MICIDKMVSLEGDGGFIVVASVGPGESYHVGTIYRGAYSGHWAAEFVGLLTPLFSRPEQVIQWIRENRSDAIVSAIADVPGTSLYRAKYGKNIDVYV